MDVFGNTTKASGKSVRDKINSAVDEANTLFFNVKRKSIISGGAEDGVPLESAKKAFETVKRDLTSRTHRVGGSTEHGNHFWLNTDEFRCKVGTPQGYYWDTKNGEVALTLEYRTYGGREDTGKWIALEPVQHTSTAKFAMSASSTKDL